MRREDWLWLLIKAAGLWLIVEGIRELAAASFTVFMPGSSWDVSGRDEAFAILLYLGAGAFLLLVDISAWLQRIGRTREAPGTSEAVAVEAQAPAPPCRAMMREDWLWVGLKLFGAYVLAAGVVSLPMLIQMWELGGSNVLIPLAGLVGYLLFGLWLLMSQRAYRMASRGSRVDLPTQD